MNKRDIWILHIIPKRSNGIIFKANADLLIKLPTLSRYIDFPKLYVFLYFLNIHRWFNITKIILHSPDDGYFEPKRYSVDFVSQ